MAPKRKLPSTRPACIKVAGDMLLSEIGKLLQESEGLCDVVLKSGLCTCRCLLVAIAGPDLDLSLLIHQLQNLDVPVQKAFFDLIHGQEATLPGAAAFFSLYETVQRLKIKPCMERCKHAVQEADLDGEIKLSLLPTHMVAVMKGLRMLRDKKQLTAKVRFTCDAGDDEELACEEIHVHQVVLAASCQYLRGLWLGGFRETSGRTDAAVRLEGTCTDTMRLMIDVAYGEEVSCASTAKLLTLFCLTDRLGFDLAAKSALECIRGRLTGVEAELLLLKQSSPPPPALMLPIAVALNRSPPTNWSWGMASLLLRASKEVEDAAPKVVHTAREVVGRCLRDRTAEKDGLSQLSPQGLASALSIEAEGKPKNEALLESVLQWAAQFAAPAEIVPAEPPAWPIVELSNLSALQEAMPRGTYGWLFLGAYRKVLRAKAFDEGRHETIADLLNRVSANLELESEDEHWEPGSESGSSDSSTGESQEVPDVVVVESTAPEPKRRRIGYQKETRFASTARLGLALATCFQDEEMSESVSAFCSGPGLHALHAAGFITLMSWFAPLDGGEVSPIISVWVRRASTDDVFEALRLGPDHCTTEIAERILGAVRERFSHVEQLYLDVEGCKVEERIAREVAAAEAAKERAFEAREAELRGQLEAAREELLEQKKRHALDAAVARSRYIAAAEGIFKSLAGCGELTDSRA